MQRWWIAKWERDREKCPKCGNDRDACSDPEVTWYPQRTVCYATMVEESVKARWRDMHGDREYHDGSFSKWSKDRTARHPFHRDDGVTIWVSQHDLTPEDKFLGSDDKQSDAEGGGSHGSAP